MITLTPVTAAELRAFYGELPRFTIRGVAIRQDGELVAIAGVTRGPYGWAAFSDIQDGVKVPKMTVWRVARAVLHWLTPTPGNVLALASRGWPNAERFLERLGFRPIGQDANGERIFQWRNCSPPPR